MILVTLSTERAHVVRVALRSSSLTIRVRLVLNWVKRGVKILLLLLRRSLALSVELTSVGVVIVVDYILGRVV